MKVKSHWALLITHIETIGRCYLLESLRYTSLLLYDVTPVSQREHNILILKDKHINIRPLFQVIGNTFFVFHVNMNKTKIINKGNDGRWRI